MTLYDLANSTMLQGNIELVDFDRNGEQVKRFGIEMVDDLSGELYGVADYFEDLEVKYIFPRIIDGEPWIRIEFCSEEDDA